ncbi:MAG: phage major tail tube protein [Terriglobales bacterium]|jgi:P2 family phage contractile tail tube protein
MFFPNVNKNSKVYNAAGAQIQGLQSIQLVKISFEKSEYRALGVSGSPNLPIQGNVTDMEVALNFHTPSDQAYALFQGGGQQLRIMSSFSGYESSIGAYGEIAEEIIMTVLYSEADHGKREYSNKADFAIRGSVPYFAAYWNGKLQHQIDPFNGVCIIGGKDLNAQTQLNLR